MPRRKPATDPYWRHDVSLEIENPPIDRLTGPQARCGK